MAGSCARAVLGTRAPCWVPGPKAIAQRLRLCRWLMAVHRLSRAREATAPGRSLLLARRLLVVPRQLHVRHMKELAAWSASAGQPPAEPDNCCGIGCVDCVWISYWERMNEFAELERQNQGLDPPASPAHVVPQPAPGGAGRGFTAADVSGQPRRKTGSATGYKSKSD